jgi:hypothetical protein
LETGISAGIREHAARDKDGEASLRCFSHRISHSALVLNEGVDASSLGVEIVSDGAL